MEPTEKALEIPQHDATEKRVSLRLQGAIFLVVGLGLAWWQIWVPLSAARNGGSTFYTSTLLLALAVILPCLGLGFLIGGDKLYKRLESASPHTQKISLAVIVVVLAVLVLVVYLLVDGALDGMGYASSSMNTFRHLSGPAALVV